VKISPRYDGPAILTIDGDGAAHAAVGVAVCRQRRRMEALLAELSDDDWQRASRCDGWRVHDVIAHLITVNGFWDTSVRAGLAGTPTRMLAAFDPAAHPPLLVQAMAELACDEILEQFVASNDGLVDALESLDDAGWLTTAEAPPGHVAIHVLAAHALWDAWIHERDIALPLGATPVEVADEVAICLEYAAAVGPALAIGEGVGFVGRVAVIAHDPDVRFTLDVGDSVAVRHDFEPSSAACLRGAAIPLVEALSIRGPMPANAPDEWRRLVNSLAVVFDSESAVRT
jgi:uncharacterized protein (TIGR03083 family)